MTTPLRAKISLPQTIALFFALTAAGLAGNYLRLEIFFSIQFLFGSIFAMLALQALGPWWGIAAGLAVSSYTWSLWNHPWAIVIMTCEVAAVGLFCRRRTMGLVMADALYWLLVGMPLVYLFYSSVMHLTIETVIVTALKQAINGIANALIARLVYMAASRRLGIPCYSLREIIFNLLILFLLVPAFLHLALQSRADVTETEQGVRDSIVFARERVAGSLEQWLKEHLDHLAYLAGIAPTEPVAAMQQRLEQSLAENPNLLRIGLMDQSAQSIAYAPLVDELGHSAVGLDFSDRPYLTPLKQSLRPMLTEAMMGRVGIPQPIVAMVVPVIKGGRFAGFIGGALNLDQLKNIIAMYAKAQMLPGILFTLTDRQGKVIVTNREDASTFEPFVRGSGELRPLTAEVGEWLPRAQKNISISDRWRTGLFVTEQTVGSLSEWIIILDQPIAPFQKKLYAKYAGHLGRLFCILIIALAVAHHLSRLASASLVSLAGISRDLPEQLATDQHIAWPDSWVTETKSLIDNFKAMTRTLARQFRDIQEMNAVLEQRVQARTAELQESREQYRLLAENASDVVWRLDLNTMCFSYVSPAATRLCGYTPEEVMAMSFEATFTPPTLLNLRAWLTLARKEFAEGRTSTLDQIRQVELRHKDGGTVWAEISSTFVVDDQHRPLAVIGISRDIGERKRMEDMLKESESRFRNLFEKVQVVSLLIDPVDGAIVDANAAAEQYYGWPRATLKTMRIAEINILPVEEVKAEIELARHEKRGHFLFKHRLADGSIRNVEVFSGPVGAEGRELLYSIVHDVTDRLQAESALREKTEELDRFFTFNLDLLCIADSDGYFRRLNPEWERCLGYPLHELTGKRFLDLVHPDDLAPTLAVVSELSQQKPVINFINRYRTADGQYRIIEWNSFPVGSLIYAAARDITARKEAEAQIEMMAAERQLILDTLSVGVLFLKNRRIQWANRALAEMFGYTMDELLGMKTRMLYVDEETYRWVGTEAYAGISTGQVYTTEVSMRHKNGAVFWASISGNAVDPADPQARSIWMVQDITTRKMAEQALQEKTGALETLTQDLEAKVLLEISARRKNEQILIQQAKLAAMGEMIGAIAHQWRQPLNTLSLCVQNVRDAWRHKVLTDDYLETTTEDALVQVRHMSRTIDDFRNFFLPDKVKTVFDSMTAAGEVLSLLSAQFTAHGITFDLYCQTHDRHFSTFTDIIPCEAKSISGYRNEFEHVLLNIINNAKDAILEKERGHGFAAGESGRIVLDFAKEESMVAIRIRDNGGGIPAAIIDRIFEPYFTTKGSGMGGTGIGLYMAKIIIEDHLHGRLTAENTADGAVFTIAIPSAESEQDLGGEAS